MTGALWFPYSTQSGSVAGESASEIFHNTAQALAVGGLIIVALLCIAVNCMLFYAHCNVCRCNTCRGLDLFWSFLGWALNTVASAHFCDSGKFSGSFVAMSRTVIGENGPTDARLFVLFILAVSLFAIALVHGVMFMNILFSSTRPSEQCPFRSGKLATRRWATRPTTWCSGRIGRLVAASRGSVSLLALLEGSKGNDVHYFDRP